MPKCVECAKFNEKLTYCREYHQKIRKYNIELPCAHFVPRATPIATPVLQKLVKERKPPTLPEEYGIGFFGPRWLNKYIVQSIQACGDMSLAYEMLLQDLKPKC